MPDGIASRFDTVAYPASDERLLDAVLTHPSTSLLSRAGVRPGGGLGVTMSTGPDAATVAPGGGILTDTGGGGSFRFVIPTAVVLTLAARPAGGTSRLDEVVAVVRNDEVRPADGTRDIDIQLIQGTAGASPSAPAIPAGALRLAELTVPASGTVLVAKPPPRIAAAGGTLLVASSTERDAISPLYDGIIVYREDTDTLEVRQNGAWVSYTPATKYRCHVKRAAVQAFSDGGSILVSWDTEVKDIGGLVTVPTTDVIVTGAGSYKCNGRFSLDNTAAGTLRVWLTKNGVDAESLYRGTAAPPTTPIMVSGSAVLEDLDPGDVIGMKVNQSTGASRNSYAGIYAPDLTVELVS